MRKFVLAAAAVALLVLAAPVTAAEAVRKINFQTVLLDADNEPMTECLEQPPLPTGECKGGAKRSMTLGLVSLRSLTFPEQGMDSAESAKRGQLGLLVYKSAGAELTVEEIALIKKQIAKTYGPLVVVRCNAILDPASTK